LFARSRILLAFLLAAGFSPAALASPRGSAIDLDPQSPTLGELLDREERVRARASVPQPARLPAAALPEFTGSIPDEPPALAAPRINPIPHVPRGATTVIVPGGQGGRSPLVRQVYPPVAPVRAPGTRDF
jgi:hypothetical protein